jgi:hypothetical protein
MEFFLRGKREKLSLVAVNLTDELRDNRLPFIQWAFIFIQSLALQTRWQL